MSKFYPFFRAAIYAILLAFTISASAQNLYTKQVIIASGGQFGNPNNYVRVGAFDPSKKSYTVFDSLRAGSTKTVLISNNFAFVTADTLIAKYNIDTHKRLALGQTTGLNSPGGQLAVYKNYLLVSRGYGADSDFVQVFNADDLTLAYTIKDISNQTSGIVVAGDTAYVGVPGPWGKDTGTIAVIDLKNMQLDREIMLDTLGAGIGKMFTDGEFIYAISSTRNIINKLNIATAEVEHITNLGASIYNGTGFSNGNIYLDINYQGIGAFSTAANAIVNNKIIDFAGLNSFTTGVSGSVYDSVSKRFYVTSTDYFSKGTAYIYNENGTGLDTFAVGVSPEALAVDYRMATSIYAPAKKYFSLKLYPNPANNFIYAEAENLQNSTLTITDITGKVLENRKINVSQPRVKVNIEKLPKGVYHISIQNNESVQQAKFIKY